MHHRSRALSALLLFVLFVALPACGGSPAAQNEAPAERSEAAPREQARTTAPAVEKTAPASGGSTVQALLPEDVLSEEEKTGMPEFKGWNDTSTEAEPIQIEGAGSAGAIPAVKPFNFGRDPGGPKDKTLYITIPKLGLEGVPAFDEVSEEALKEGTAHIPATGYPWQEGANVYVAGHRLGYPDTGSDRVFYDLDQLFPGDEIFVTDSAGGEYKYTVTEQVVVPADNVEVMNPVPDKSLLSLQTCTLPDYVDRIVVQAELV